MAKVIALLIASLISAPVLAQDNGPIRLQCTGTYSDFPQKLLDIPAKGFYVEIGSAQAKVQGSPGFDGVYTVSTRREDGIGLTDPNRPGVGGWLNRFTGDLTLSLRKDIDSRGRTNILNLIRATCTRANALF